MILRLNDVSQRFSRRWILQRLSFEVPQGAAVLLTGENGAGKTTLLRILGTALRPTRGSLELFGSPAWEGVHKPRARLGLMTHQHYLYENLSAAENLAVVCKLSGRGTPAAQKQVLERVGLASFAQVAVSTYSAGMKRRLAVARLLLGEPELVLLDEPFGQLDPSGIRLMESIIVEMRKNGATQVISTHDIDRAAALCSLKLHLHCGRIANGGLIPLQGKDPGLRQARDERGQS